MVINIFCLVQLPYAFVIGVFRTQLAELHNFFTVNGKRVLKAVIVPVLEQGHIQAKMRRRKPLIGAEDGEKSVEMADVVHKRRASPPTPLRVDYCVDTS